MWALSAPGGDAESCFLRLTATDYHADLTRRPHELAWMPDVRAPPPPAVASRMACSCGISSSTSRTRSSRPARRAARASRRSRSTRPRTSRGCPRASSRVVAGSCAVPCSTSRRSPRAARARSRRRTLARTDRCGTPRRGADGGLRADRRRAGRAAARSGRGVRGTRRAHALRRRGRRRVPGPRADCRPPRAVGPVRAHVGL
jgi:hypothetical protein